MQNRPLLRKVRNYNIIVICLALLAFVALVLRAGMLHFEYPDGYDVHVLTSSVTITSDESGDKILCHGRLPQYFLSGSVIAENGSKLHLVVDLEDIGDSDELLLEVWNANVEARIDGKLVGTFLDKNPIRSISSYYYTIPLDAVDNGKTLTLDYWRERSADIPWTFPEIMIGTSSELFHHTFFPYRLMVILASMMMYLSFTMIVGLCFYRNRPGVQKLLYSYILLLLGTFHIISACPASVLVGGSNINASLVGQIGISLFPAFLYLFYEKDGAIKRNMFFLLLSYAHLLLGILDLLLLLFGVGASGLDIALYLSSSLYLLSLLVYAIYQVVKQRESFIALDFASLVLFTLSSFYLSFMIVSGYRTIVGLYMFTAMMIVGLSMCSYKVIIGLTRNNVALMKRKTLEEKSYKDVLTGLDNRRSLRKTLDTMDIPPEGVGIGIAYFDIDGMKRCNDTLGHEAGDKMLKNFAVASSISPGTTYRIGGDEFVMILFVEDGSAVERYLDLVTKDFSRLMGGLFSVSGYGIYRVVTERKELGDMLEDAEAGMRRNKKEHRS